LGSVALHGEDHRRPAGVRPDVEHVEHVEHVELRTAASGGWPPLAATALHSSPVGRREATWSPRLGDPEDIAAVAVFLLSDEAAWINGQVLDVNGGRLLG
jgi:NAD(P)-dependent dehydrogenase (short-subunit alcohol dehydrogenase family)